MNSSSPGIDLCISFIHTDNIRITKTCDIVWLPSVGINVALSIYYYNYILKCGGMALGRPPPPLKKVTCRNKENDKQYETKRVWNLLQSWLVGNQGVLKGGGGVQLVLPPLKYF